MKKIVLFLTSVLLLAFNAHGKEMNHRLGVGPKSAFSSDIGTGIESIGVHYSPNATYQVVGSVGINTSQGSSVLGLQGGLRRILFEEKNMNFFVGGSLGLVSREIASVNRSGFELLATVGGEWFFEGLENLGFNFETGLGVSSLTTSNSFFTLARSPMTAGIIFYF